MSVNAIANKLNPLLEFADVSDVSLVRRYKDELELSTMHIISTYDDFHATFAGDLETLAPFLCGLNPGLQYYKNCYIHSWLAR